MSNQAQKKSTVEDRDSSFLIDIATIQQQYLPLSKKRIRNIVTSYIHTIRVGNKLLVNRKQLEDFLSNPDREEMVLEYK